MQVSTQNPEEMFEPYQTPKESHLISTFTPKTHGCNDR